MRILHINKYNHERDGVGRYMHDVMRLADAHGHATAVLAMHYPKNNPSPWEHFFVSNLETARAGKGIDALRQLARTFWSYEAYKKTCAIISAFKPDVIHAHNLYTHLSPSVLSAAKDMGIPVILTAHDYGYISANYGLFDGVAPISARASWREITKTKYIKNSALATGVVDAIIRIQKKFGMWTNGVTHILTASEAVKHALIEGGYRESLIQSVPLPSGTYDVYENETPILNRAQRIIFASRFETYKGIDVVMELVARMPDVEFVCIGHGKEEEKLRILAARAKNLNVISVLPPRELWEMIRGSAGVIMPSRWPEPFGLVALEALALGTPAMVSSLGGLSEIVEHGVSGFMEHPDDLGAWEKDIRALLAPKGGKATAAQQEMYKEALARGKRVGDPGQHWERLFSVYSEANHQKGNL
jgi:glycosyltransferase involved in cell wall biosynthesis